MNGPATIYRLKPVFEIPKKIDLPDCMYKLKSPVACLPNLSENFEAKESSDILTSIMDKVNTLIKPEPITGLAALEAKWDGIIAQLMQLKSQLADMRKTVSVACKLTGYSLVNTTTLNSLKILQGAVINASPTNPPYSLLLIRHLCKSDVPIVFSTHTHSTLTTPSVDLTSFNTSGAQDLPVDKSLKLHLIWKDDLLDTELVMNPVKQLPIKGEVNILKILARSGLETLRYPSEDILKTTQIDSTLDLCHRLVHSRVAKEKSALCKSLNGRLGRQPYFGGSEINIIDVSAWSIIKQVFNSIKEELSPNMLKWYQKMDKLPL